MRYMLIENWVPFTSPSEVITAHGVTGQNPPLLEDDGAVNTPAPQDPSKPLYRVPSIVDIAAVKATSGLRVVSTFSGCGGSCLGFEMAGYEVVWASEFVPAAQEVYRLNHPGVPLDCRDIRQVQAEDILAAAGLERGEVDVMEGSPPCASFSTAGRTSQHWGQTRKYSDTEQRTDDLFYEFVRLVEGVRPRVFVAENVSGLVKGVAKGYFQRVFRAMEAIGYQVEARMLDAQWLGVPQSRQRIIFQGVRSDVGRKPAWPKPLPYRYTLADAIGVSGTLAAWGLGSYEHRNKRVMPEQSTDQPCPTITTDYPAGSSGWELRVVHDTSGLFSTGDVTDRPAPAITVGVNSANSHHYQVIRVGANAGYGTETWQGPDQPIKTIGASPQTGNGLVGAGDLITAGDRIEVDPETGYRISLDGSCLEAEYDQLAEGESSDRIVTERRKFTLGELRRVCGFPDDFALTGSYQQRWERLGRAVPPPMMYAVARAVREGVLGVSCPDAYS